MFAVVAARGGEGVVGGAYVAEVGRHVEALMFLLGKDDDGSFTGEGNRQGRGKDGGVRRIKGMWTGMLNMVSQHFTVNRMGF